MKKMDLLEEQLRKDLEKLISFPERDEERSNQTRQRFLMEAKIQNREYEQRKAVSMTHLDRLKRYNENLQKKFNFKERFTMNPIGAILTILTLLFFGGGGATAYAAQNSLPNDLLYPVKLAGESIHLELTTDSASQLELALAYASRRVEEATAMIQNGEELPETVANQLEQNYNLALMLALGMDEEENEAAIEKIRSNIRQQERLMTNLGEGLGQENAVLFRMRETLRSQNRLCEEALEEPLKMKEMFQQQLQHQESTSDDGDVEIAPQPTMTGLPATECVDCDPALDGTGPGAGPNEQPGSGQGMNGDSGNGGSANCTATPAPNGDSSGPDGDPGSDNGQQGGGGNN